MHLWISFYYLFVTTFHDKKAKQKVTTTGKKSVVWGDGCCILFFFFNIDTSYLIYLNRWAVETDAAVKPPRFIMKAHPRAATERWEWGRLLLEMLNIYALKLLPADKSCYTLSSYSNVSVSHAFVTLSASSITHQPVFASCQWPGDTFSVRYKSVGYWFPPFCIYFQIKYSQRIYWINYNKYKSALMILRKRDSEFDALVEQACVWLMDVFFPLHFFATFLPVDMGESMQYVLDLLRGGTPAMSYQPLLWDWWCNNCKSILALVCGWLQLSLYDRPIQ